MPAPTSTDEFLDLVRKSGVLDDKRFEAYVEKLRAADNLPATHSQLAKTMVHDGILTTYQSEQLLLGRWRRFTIGKYKVLERLGSGGMGSVFLCEHKFMRRLVAVKVLPTAKAADPSSLERFYREARAVAAVDHPNIVHAYDIDQDDNLHFIVMEHVDGPTLQDIVRRSGPLSLERACHYISQAAQGLAHANKVSIVHRDIKPGNILVDSSGVVKILDMGLARFFNDEDDLLTRKYDENVLGTADYLAPEQADDSHAVDIRADIYSLGGTFYFLLTGKTPFGEGNVPQKLMWHRTRQPKPLNSYRDDVPAEVQAVIDKMMAKEPGQRFQDPAEISAALAPWTATPIPPPAEAEMPRLSPAVASTSTTSLPALPGTGLPGSSTAKKTWQVSGTTLPGATPASGTAKGPTTPVTPPASRGTKGTKPAGAALAPPRPATATRPVHAGRPAAQRPTPKPTSAADTVTEEVASGPDTVDASARGKSPKLTASKLHRAAGPIFASLQGANPKVVVLAAAAAAVVLSGVLGVVTVGILLKLLGR
jgi:serine/threonine protein kinase